MDAQDLQAARSVVRRLLDENSPADALAAYYILHHDAARTELFTHLAPNGRPDGFLVRARTGQDLFRPLITARARGDAVAGWLLTEGLVAGRPYYMTLPENVMQVAVSMLQIDNLETLQLYRLDPARYQPQVNVMVVNSRSPEGWPRCQISSQGQIYSTAGLNWRAPRYAEIYVFTEPAARGRGWGRAVVSALVNRLIKQGCTPLYAVDKNNTTSIRLAEEIGFVDSGFREYACTATRLGA